jgi:hypothetical protein
MSEKLSKEAVAALKKAQSEITKALKVYDTKKKKPAAAKGTAKKLKEAKITVVLPSEEKKKKRKAPSAKKNAAVTPADVKPEQQPAC